MATAATDTVQRSAKPPEFQSKRSKPNAFPSLFDPDTDEEFSDDSHSDSEILARASILHLNKVIDRPPRSLTALLEVLLPRLQPRPEVKGVSLDDQQSFGSILVGELASQFSILHHQIDDPFLDPLRNRELHKQIAVKTCEIIEQLYAESIYKATKLSRSGVLSLSANMAHLKAQLMVQVNKALNIPLIRKQVLDGLRGPIVSQPVVERYCKQKRLPPLPKQRATIPKWLLLEQKHTKQPSSMSRPRQQLKSEFGIRLESGAVRRRIRKLKARLPTVPVMVSSSPSTSDGDSEEEEVSLWRRDDDKFTGETTEFSESVSEDVSQANRKQRVSSGELRRVSSLPELWGEFLLCDVGCTTRHKRPTSVQAKEVLLKTHRPPSVGRFMDLKLADTHSSTPKPTIQLGEHTLDDLANDLRNLERQSSQILSLSSDDLHPLLQAHVHGLSSKQAARLAEFEASLQKEEVVAKKTPTPQDSSLMDEAIPSVATLDQLPYLNIEHASDDSCLSLHVKSKDVDYEGDQTSFVSTSISGFASASCHGKGSSQLHSEEGIDSCSEIARLEEIQGSEDPNLMDSSNVTDNLDSLRSSPSSYERPRSPPLSPRPGEPEEVASPQPDGSGDLESGPTAHPQGAVVTTSYPGQGVVRTADVRVSERTPLTHLRLKFYGPVYNELAEDWDSSMTEELDSNLHEGRNISLLYSEIMKTLPTDHSKFENEPMLEPAIDKPVDLSKILASSTLHHRRSQRVVNPTLYRNMPCPWGRDTTREEWEESNQYKGLDKEIQQSTATGVSPQISRKYALWLAKWKSTINSEDFFKFVSKDESDYLRLIYHLYESEGSDSEEEEEAREKRERLAALHAKLRAKEEKRRQRYRDKNHYQQGMWNVNSVLMGGLGGDPEETSSDEEDEASLAKINEKANSREAVQSNLQQIWSQLHMPSNQQADMAIKYSGDFTPSQLNKILNLWESVCNAIEKREVALMDLESFEKKASDPSRFFAKGEHGSAAVRLKEAQTRDRLHTVLDRLDRAVSQLIQLLQKECGDIVTYKGRPYSEKMRLDRTEMLYWLQQQRRQAVLKPAEKTLTLDIPHSSNIVS